MQTENFHKKADYVIKHLLYSLSSSVSRTNFCKTLSAELSSVFKFDRLAINLYDSEGGMLSYFTSIEGTVIKSLSASRPADSSGVMSISSKVTSAYFS